MKTFIRRHYILFGFLVLAVLFLVFCAPWVPSNAATSCDPSRQNCSSDASYRYGNPDIVRNSVFTKELADQCADTAHYDCRLVKSAPDKPEPQRRFPHLQGRQ